MKTVKEVSALTGVSVRTLHYYDEIGLLKPSVLSEAGYRLYDESALAILHKILFFRELDIPLKTIRLILENPDIDQQQVLRDQKKILAFKKERLERLLASIDMMLAGESEMNFSMFSQADMMQLYRAMVKNMSKGNQAAFIQEYGSLENFEQAFLSYALGEPVQKSLSQAAAWYGSKESALRAVEELDNAGMESASQRLDAALRALAAKVGTDVTQHEIMALVQELDSAAKQLYQMQDASAFLLDMAKNYIHNQKMQVHLDAEYGDGSTEFIGRALEAFYKR